MSSAAILELLDPDALERTAVYADAYLVGRYQPPEDPSFLCDTHWCPLDANLTLPSPAQNPFEVVISRLCASPIFQAHVRRALRGCACAGVEWWLQEQDGKDRAKELHTDAMTWSDGGTLRTAHPALSTVLYLSASGGPTAVFAQRRAGPGELEPPEPTEVTLAFPRPGDLLVFDGALLHCVLEATSGCIAPTEAQSRRTLLLNWWAPHDWQRLRQQSPAPPLPPPPLPLPIVSGAGTARGVREVRAPHPFADDASAWRAQRAPPWVERGLEAPAPPLRIVYGMASPGAARDWTGDERCQVEY